METDTHIILQVHHFRLVAAVDVSVDSSVSVVLVVSLSVGVGVFVCLGVVVVGVYVAHIVDGVVAVAVVRAVVDVSRWDER